MTAPEAATPAARVSHADEGAVTRWATADLWWLSLISALAAVLRLAMVEQWSWSAGEAVTWRALTQPLGGEHGFASSAQGLHPLAYLLERGLLASGLLPGATEGWLRLPFAFVGAVMVPCIAVLARRPLGRGTALLAALVLAVHPAHVKASQTADPVVVAATLALLAGAVAQRLPLRYAWSLVVLAGLSHPLGWLLGGGLVVALAGGPSSVQRLRERLAAVPRWRWFAGAALLLPWGVDLWLIVRGSVAVLAVVGLVAVPASRRLGALVAVLFAVGGVAGWWLPTAPVDVLLATLPLNVLLAATAATQLFSLLRSRLPATSLLQNVVAALSALVLIGELATGVFLYFLVHQGGRPPWREVQRAVLATLRAGSTLHVLAGEGCAPLGVYLRPNHYGDDRVDAHPGTRVERLADGAARSAQLQQAGVLLALSQRELDALRGDSQLAPLLQPFVEHRVFPCPQPGRDQSLHLLWRPLPQ